MKRRLFTIALLLLFAAVVVLWVRSCFVEDHLTPRADYLIVSRVGTLTLCHFQNTRLDVPVQRYMTVRRQLYATICRDLWDTAESRWSFARISYARMKFRNNGGYQLLAIPYWAVLVVTGVLPVLWLLRTYRARAVQRRGLCRRCGYDLRATPVRCPECGTPSS